MGVPLVVPGAPWSSPSGFSGRQPAEQAAGQWAAGTGLGLGWTLQCPLTRHWQDLGYMILYITGRPDMQKQRVVSWLSQHNFPQGMIFFSDGLVHDPLRQKAIFLRNLVQEVSVRPGGRGFSPEGVQPPGPSSLLPSSRNPSGPSSVFPPPSIVQAVASVQSTFSRSQWALMTLRDR